MASEYKGTVGWVSGFLVAEFSNRTGQHLPRRTGRGNMVNGLRTLVEPKTRTPHRPSHFTPQTTNEYRFVPGMLWMNMALRETRVGAPIRPTTARTGAQDASFLAVVGLRKRRLNISSTITVQGMSRNQYVSASRRHGMRFNRGLSAATLAPVLAVDELRGRHPKFLTVI